jgi:hypothetical protein
MSLNYLRVADAYALSPTYFNTNNVLLKNKMC